MRHRNDERRRPKRTPQDPASPIDSPSTGIDAPSAAAPKYPAILREYASSGFRDDPRNPTREDE